MIIDAINFLPDKFYLRLIGGQKQQRADFKKKYYHFIKQGRLIIDEPIPHLEIREMIIKADIAILPTPSLGFSNFTSPLKLFEYMASGMPIVVSNSEIFREILSQKNSLFFKENDSKDLAQKIKYLSENQKIAQKIGRNAFFDSKKYTYQKRAEKISWLFSNK